MHRGVKEYYSPQSCSEFNKMVLQGNVVGVTPVKVTKSVKVGFFPINWVVVHVTVIQRMLEKKKKNTHLSKQWRIENLDKELWDLQLVWFYTHTASLDLGRKCSLDGCTLHKSSVFSLCGGRFLFLTGLTYFDITTNRRLH